jgi:hypothetical protein
VINDDRSAGNCVHSVFNIKFRSGLLTSAWDRYPLKWSSAYKKQHAKAELRKYTFCHQHPTASKLFVFKITQEVSLNIRNNVHAINYKTNFFSECLSTLGSDWDWRKKLKDAGHERFSPRKQGPKFKHQTNPCWICCGQADTETGYPLSTVILPSRFHSTNDRYSFIRLQRLNINLSNDAFIKSHIYKKIKRSHLEIDNRTYWRQDASILWGQHTAGTLLSVSSDSD